MKKYTLHIVLACAIATLLMVPKGVSWAVRGSARHMAPKSSKHIHHEQEIHALGEELARVRAELEELKSVVPHKEISVAHVVARVTRRDPGSWNSFLEVNKGEEDGVQPDAPVLFGRHLIGVVEHVFQNASVIRMITDTSLPVSVRVKREEALLAKGFVHGKGLPMWRSFSYRLVGKGFNYDFADDEGPALDLRTGLPYEDIGAATPRAIIQRGDTLVTTGMDGVFPKGLLVGEVTQVAPLEEGATTYSIEAVTSVGSLHEIESVAILL